MGSLALVEAARSWDPERAELWTYARLAVEGAMIDHLRHASIERPSDEIPDHCAAEAPLPDELVREHQRRQRLSHALETLPTDEAEVLRRIYREGDTQETIARDFGRGQQFVSKLHRRAIERIRPDVMVARAA